MTHLRHSRAGRPLHNRHSRAEPALVKTGGGNPGVGEGMGSRLHGNDGASAPTSVIPAQGDPCTTVIPAQSLPS